MDGERIIFHVDVNSAFLSWSAVKRLQDDPGAVDPRTIPSAVGGDVETRHGIITAKSIPAKRYGIVTGEPVVKALQKCPGLVLVSSDWEAYRAYSNAFIRILLEYSELVQQASIDEAYVDMTEAVETAVRRTPTDADGGDGIAAAAGTAERTDVKRATYVPTGAADNAAARAAETEERSPKSMRRSVALALAASLREEIRTQLGFTVNVGVSSNKLLAKMASDFQKPDRTHTLWPEEVPTKMWPLPIGDLYGCGGKTASRLAGIGITTIGDAADADPAMLQSFLGEKSGAYITAASRGDGSDRVHTEHEDARSYSNETTTSEDITLQSYDRLTPPLLHHLSEKVARRMQRDGVYGSTVTVSVKTNDFHRRSRQKKLDAATNDAAVIEQHAKELLRGLLYERDGIFDRGAGVRLIGVGMSSLDHGEYRQLSLEDFLQDQEKEKAETASRARQEKLQEMLQKVQSRYGSGSLRKGNELL